MNYYPRQFFKIKDIEDCDTIGAVMGANPSEQAFFICWLCNASEEDNENQQFTYRVEVEYIVKFTEPKNRMGTI